MRSLRLAVLPLLVATSLAAQAPSPSSPTPTPAAVVAPRRTAFFDVAALVGSRERFGLEPLVFGRWTIGVIATHGHSGSLEQQNLNAPDGLPRPVAPCPSFGCGAPSPSSYNAWSFDITVRYYPAFLTSRDLQRRFMLYLGEFVGYQWRTINQPEWKQYLAGLEPGAEAGLRLKPLGPLFIDVGGWFKLVTVDDPTQRLRPGQLDSRLVAAVGIGW
jgi:hypothetical protein